MKKKYLCCLLGGMAAFMAAPTVSYAATASPVIANTEIQAEQGDEFTTTVYLPKNSNVISFEADLKYDSSAFSLVEAKAYESVEVNEKDGVIKIAYSATENQVDKINVVDLTFSVNEELASGTYDLFTVKSASAASKSESGELDNYNVTTDFKDLSLYRYGDADLDGTLKPWDSTLVQLHIIGREELEDLQIKYANAFMDFEEDKVTPKISARDAGIILQRVVEKEGLVLGDRANIKFYDNEGEVYAERSVKVNAALNSVPEFPEIPGLDNIRWSLDPNEYVEVDFSKIKCDFDVFCFGEENENGKILRDVETALENAFPQSDKLINGVFQLPYKSANDVNNIPGLGEYKNVEVTWSIDSGPLQESLNTSNYIFTKPEDLDYTTWVTFKANIYNDGVKIGVKEFKREIKGKIDMPDSSQFEKIIKAIPKTIEEHYRLPGYVSLENNRISNKVNNVQNVDIKWTIVKNADGLTADPRVLDASTNEILYLKDETTFTLQYDFMFEGHSIYSGKIERTIPAKSIEGQVEYAKEYIKSYIPSVISGETYFPIDVPLYDISVSWIPNEETGKVAIGRNETVNGKIYKVIDIGEKAGYMEWSSVSANIERNGDEEFKREGLTFDVQLAGNSTEITMDKISDINLYKEFIKIFDKKYGDDDGILTEEEVYSQETMEALGYELDLSDKGIRNISGVRYLKYYKKLDLSDNDLSGTESALGALASLNYLEQLSLSNCKISEIPDSVFSSKYLLEGLDLSYNKLKDVDFLTLTDSKTQADMPFTELKELFLQGNYISDISNLSYVDGDGNVVSRTPNVKVLTLSRDLNYIEYDTKENGEKVFRDVEKYEYNILSSMDIKPIGLMEGLTTLWLGNNFIEDIEPIANCKLLTTLDLSGNSISAKSVGPEDGLAPLSELESLVCLKLDGNNIHTIYSLRYLRYLEILSLSNNSITDFSDKVPGLNNLTYLDLDGNQLKSFNAKNYPKLTRLYLENQRKYDSETKEYTKTLTQVLGLDKAPELVELRLNHNDLEVESIESIAVLTKLEYLSLSGSKVANLEFLKDLTLLRHLELADCGIKQSMEVVTKNESTGETNTESISNLTFLADKTNLVILDLSDNGGIEVEIPEEEVVEPTETPTEEETTEAPAEEETTEAEPAAETEETEATEEATEATTEEATEAATDEAVSDVPENTVYDGISDISALSGLENLRVFYIDNVKLESAAAIKNMTGLQYLSMQNSGLEDAEFLNTLNSLEYLNLSGHECSTFSFGVVSGCENLKGLFLDSATYTEGKGLDELSSNYNLKYLSIANVHVDSIDNLPDIKNIVYLGLRNTNISDFNGTYSEGDGYLKSVARFSNLRYLDVADNPELFTNKNLEMLYDLADNSKKKTAIILYRNNAPKGYVVGLMDASIEAKMIKNDIDFGDGGTDITAALEAGYTLQSELNGYEIEWNIAENDYYRVEDGKLYFKNVEGIEEQLQSQKIDFEIFIKNLYYRENDPTTQPMTPVSFTASIQQEYKDEPTGDKIVSGRRTTWHTEDTLEGWILEPEKTVEGTITWSDWSDWTDVKITATDLLEVETGQELRYTEWSEWSEWSSTKPEQGENVKDTMEVESRQDAHTSENIVYFPKQEIINNSIYDSLKAIGADYSKKSRARIAVVNGLAKTTEEYLNDQTVYYNANVAMCKLLSEGKLIDIIDTKTEYTVSYRFRVRVAESVEVYRYREGKKSPTTYYFYQDVYEDVMHKVVDRITLVVEQ